MQNEIIFKLLKGSAIRPYLDKIANFRIQNFKEFPYLYEGNTEYEKKYLEVYLNEPKAILIIGFNPSNEIIAISTGMPVTSNADLLATANDLFRKNDLNPEEYFYIAETIISYSDYRKKGLYKKIVMLREQAATDLGFHKLCFVSVIREPNHPLRPIGYQSPDAIFNHCGYKKSSMIIKYHWPTIQADRTVVEQENALVFWFKSLA